MTDAEKFELEALRARERAAIWRHFAEAMLVRVDGYGRPGPMVTDAALRAAVLSGIAKFGLTFDWSEPEGR